MPHRLIVILVVAALIVPSGAIAQGASVTVPSFVLDVPTGTRSLGMALTGVADDLDPSNVFHNPAVITYYRGIWLTGSYDNWKSDFHQFDFQLAGGGQPLSTPALRVGVSLMHSRSDSRQLIPGSVNKIRAHESYMTGTLGAGWLGERFRLGAGGSLKWSTAENPGDETLYEAGVLAQTAIADVGGQRVTVSIGWSLRNGGLDSERKIEDGENEVILTSQTADDNRGALSFRYETFDSEVGPWDRTTDSNFAISASLESSDGGDRAAVAFETVFQGALSLRYGYRDSVLPGKHAQTLGIGAGRRFSFFHFRLDYAFAETHDSSQSFHAFGLTMGFDV